ncbi:hypothetical protein [Leptospira idonii]|uniref:Uncharacterized protein n=1 Tax=Leptospira idonii TaxID=1193500 RepID=A0A4R9LX24_9LEPT|nr:hypothetical protein [Leptospira idonii]TGN17657.1 hypothetical protein EHS15_16665 [Leptospira idonii]
MTEKVTNAITNEKSVYKIKKLHSWSITPENVIIIEADIQNESVIFKNLCTYIKSPYRYLEVVFSECKPIPNTKKIDAKLLSKEEWINTDSVYMKFKIPIFAQDENQVDYYEITGVPKFENISDHSISKMNTNQMRFGLMPVYPLAFSYDLVAGTLHTIGMPFGAVCFIGFRNEATGRNFDHKSFKYFLSMPFCGTYIILSYPSML